MGTNYYASFIVAREDIYGKTYHTRETLHIGKSSGGWVFSWHGYESGDSRIVGLPIVKITTIDEWITVLSTAEAITDEYYREYNKGEFIDKALNWNTGKVHAYEYREHGHTWAEWYNNAVYSFSTGHWS